MPPETPFIETPEIPLALKEPKETGGVFIDKLDFYNPVVYQPNTLVQSNTGAVSNSNPITEAFDRKIKELEQEPWAKFTPDRPIETPLSQTLRYNNDELGGYRRNDPSQEYRYGENQGLLNSVKTRLMQFGGNFISTYLGSFADTPILTKEAYDLASDIYAGKDKTESAIDAYRGLFDNQGLSALDDLNKWFLEGNETYDTRFSEKHQILSGKLLGDIVASSGFALGSIGGMLSEDFIIGGLTGGTALLPLWAMQAAKAFKAVKLLNSGELGFNSLKSVIKAGKAAEKGLDEAYAVSKLQKGFFRLNTITNGMYESSIEAKQAQQSTEDKIIADFSKKNGRAPNLEELTEIKKTANEVGNYTFFGNMALLSLTNQIEFGDIIKRMQVGKEAFDYTEKGLVKLAAKGLDTLEITNKAATTAIKSEGKMANVLSKAKEYAGKTGAVGRSSLGQMIEEGGQTAVSDAAEEYHTLKYNKGGMVSADQWAKSLVGAMGHVVSSEEGWMGMLAGLGGGMVMGGLTNLIDNNSSNKAPDHDQIVGGLNNGVQLSEILSGMGSKLNQHVNALGVNERSAKSSSYYETQTNQHASIYNWTLSALKGRNNYLDARKDQLNNAKELEGKEFEQQFKIPYNEANKLSVNKYIDDVIAETDNIKNKYEKVQAVFKNPYGYAKDPTPQDINNYNLYEGYKDELIFQLSKQAFNEKISSDLTTEGMLLNQNLGNDLILKLSTKSGLELVRRSEDATTNTFGNKRSDKEGIISVQKELLTEQKRLADLVSSGIASDNDVSALDKLTSLVDKANSAIETWNKEENTHADFVNDYVKYTFEKQNIQKPLNTTEITQLISIGYEQNKIKASTERSLSLYNLLASKKGFEKFLDMELASQSRFVQGLAIQEEGTSDEDPINPSVAKEGDLAVIFQAIADKINAKESLTEEQTKIYKEYKSTIDDIVRIDEENNNPEETNNPEPPEKTDKPEPIIDPYTGFREGDVIRSTVSKDSFVISKLDGEFYYLKKQDGTVTKWTYKHAHTYFDYGKWTLTGRNSDYTQKEVDGLQEVFTIDEIIKLSEEFGGYREAANNSGDLIYVQVFVKSKEGKGFLLTRRGIINLIEKQKKLPPIPKEGKKKKNYTSAGRQKDKTGLYGKADTRTPLEQAIQMGLNSGVLVPNGLSLSFANVLKNVLKSPYATVPEQEIARFMLLRIGPDARITLNTTKSFFSFADGVNIDYSDTGLLEDAPIEHAIIHEALHYFTANELRTNKEFKQTIEKLYDYAKQRAADTDQLGKWRGIEDTVNSLDEFLVEGLTSPNFMRFLASINAGDSKSPKNLWLSFIDAVARVLKIPTRNTMFDFLAETVFTQIDKVNSVKVDSGNVGGMKFNPNIIFNKLSNSKEKVILNLRNSGNYTKDYIMKNGTVITVPANSTPFPGFISFTNPITGETFSRIKFVYRTTEFIEIRVDGQMIGAFAPVSTWYYVDSEGKEKPLVDLPESEYSDVTGNLASTYSQFMTSIRNHLALEKAIASKSKGKKIPLSSLGPIFDLSAMNGTFDIIKNEALRPAVNELSDSFPVFGTGPNRGPKPVILSLSKQYNPAIDNYEERKLAFISEIPFTGNETDPKVSKLIQKVANKKETELRSLNARYFVVVSKTGKWESESDIEFVIAHPKNMEEQAKQEFVDNLKELTTKVGLKPSDFQFDGFISDPYKTKRELKLLIAKNQLVLYSKNPSDDSASFSKGITGEEIRKLNTFEDFITLLNGKLAERKLPLISSADFKVYVKDDGEVLVSDLADGLVSVTSPKIRKPYVMINGVQNLSPINAEMLATNNITPELLKPTIEEESDLFGNDDLPEGYLEEENRPAVVDDLDGLFGDEELPEEVESLDRIDNRNEEEYNEGMEEPAVVNTTNAQDLAKKRAISQRKTGGFRRYDLEVPQEVLNEYRRKCLGL